MFTLTWQDEQRGGNGNADGSYGVDCKDGQFLLLVRQDYVQRMGSGCILFGIMYREWDLYVTGTGLCP